MHLPIDPPPAAWVCLLAIASAAFAIRERRSACGARVKARIAAQRSEALLRATREAVVASRESSHAVVAVLDRAVRACAADVDAIAFFERREDRLHCTFASGRRLEHFLGRVVALDADAVCANAARNRYRCTAHRPEAVLHPGDRVSLAVPLVGPQGELAVFCTGSRFPIRRTVIDLVAVLVEQAAPAYFLALDREDDRRRATFDGLTGLLTSRAFRTALREEVERARSDPQSRFALVFVDTDHFKDWNDTYGHAAGDLVLRRLADVLRLHARASGDLVGRNGGDEFCVVLGGVEKSVAIDRARALCDAIAAHAWSLERPSGATEILTITASIGVASFPRDARTAEDLLEKADAAMYHSKHAGRNRVSYYDEGALASVPSAKETRDDRAARCS